MPDSSASLARENLPLAVELIDGSPPTRRCSRVQVVEDDLAVHDELQALVRDGEDCSWDRLEVRSEGGPSGFDEFVED